MLDALDVATRTTRVDAEVLGVLFVLDDGLATGRAVVWHAEYLFRARAVFEHGANHLRDHIAGPLHDHGVADANVLAVDVLFVVQRRMPHDHATDLDGLELGKRVERTRASDVDLDAEQFRGARRGRKLERDRPPRIATDGAQRRLQSKIVDLDDRAIDVVVQALAVAQDRMTRLADRLDPNHPLDAGIDRKATFTEPRQRLGLRRKRDPLQRTDRIAPKRQWSLGRDRRIELPQRPSRRITRIHIHR